MTWASGSVSRVSVSPSPKRETAAGRPEGGCGKCIQSSARAVPHSTRQDRACRSPNECPARSGHQLITINRTRKSLPPRMPPEGGARRGQRMAVTRQGQKGDRSQRAGLGAQHPQAEAGGCGPWRGRERGAGSAVCQGRRGNAGSASWAPTGHDVPSWRTWEAPAGLLGHAGAALPPGAGRGGRGTHLPAGPAAGKGGAA